MEEKNINRLLKLCDEYFLQNRHCKNYIQHCKNTWYKGILSFMNELGVEDYSPDIGQKYLQSASGALLVEKYPRVIRRGIHMLDDLFNIGRIRRRCYTKTDFPLEGEIGGLAKGFIAYLQVSGRKEHTLYNHRRHLSRLVSYLTDKKYSASCRDGRKPSLLLYVSRSIGETFSNHIYQRLCQIPEE